MPGRIAAAVALAVALAAVLLAAPGIGGARSPAGLDCRAGYVDGIVGGVHKCLHAGEFCSPDRQADYARYGFACIGGHLKAGKAAPAKPRSTKTPTRTTLLARRTRTTGCAVHGLLPDRRCSPGAIYADATLAMICTSGYSSRVRSVGESTRAAVFGEYGIPFRHYGSAYEVDHIVSLELGGSNDPANLYPEAAPGFHTKDRLENRLHALICAHRMPLRQAQRGIAANWAALYLRVYGSKP